MVEQYTQDISGLPVDGDVVLHKDAQKKPTPAVVDLEKLVDDVAKIPMSYSDYAAKTMRELTSLSPEIQMDVIRRAAQKRWRV